MTQRLFYIGVSVVLGFGSVLAQSSDTLSVYFAFGKHEISAKQARRIHAIPNNIYVNDLDSVHYIGMTDSVGSLKANHKLGEKRAREVMRASKSYFTTNPNIRIYSKGEVQRDDPASNRRVDVIFFSKPVVEEVKKIDWPDTLCLKRADSLFHRSLVRDVQYRRKDYTLIETIVKPQKRKNTYYYMHRIARTSEKDTFEIKELRWSLSSSKSTISEAPDYYSRVPKNDFGEFGIFTMTRPPCAVSTYDQDEYFELKSGPKVKCLQVDRFLMHHLLVKRILFNKKEVRVRVPKVYVNMDNVYFFEAGDTVKWSSLPPLSEKRKKKNRKRRWRKRKLKKAAQNKYYYTRVRTRSSVLENVLRIMDCSPSYSEPSEAKRPFCSALGPCVVKCGKQLDLFLEAGFHSFLSVNRNYLALGSRFLKENHTLRIAAGISDSTSFFGSVSYAYSLFSFGLSNPAHTASWTEPHKLENPKTFVSLYAGTRLNAFGGETWILNQNVHGGASLDRTISKYKASLFSEIGLGTNYSLPERQRVGTSFLLGIRVHLGEITQPANQGGGARFL